MSAAQFVILIPLRHLLHRQPPRNFALILGWGCLPPCPSTILSLSNLQLYSRPNIGVGMLGWAVYVSHNKASHKGVALSLTSSHLTAQHGQVVCMETHLRVCVCVQWGPGSSHPPLHWWGREITPSTLPSRCFIWSLSLRFVSRPSITDLQCLCLCLHASFTHFCYPLQQPNL